MQIKERIKWADNAKYICIFLVILSHLSFVPRLLEIFYSPFFLTTFFFVSGYLFKGNIGFKEHLVKKIRGLLVPWFFFSMFIIITQQIISTHDQMEIGEAIQWNFLQIRGAGDNIWFVAALFAAFIPFYFFVVYMDINKALILSFALWLVSKIYNFYMPGDVFIWKSPALPWHLEYIFIAMFFMILGYYYRNKAEDVLNKYINHKNISIVMMLYIILVLFNYFAFDFLESYFVTKTLFGLIISLVGIAMCIGGSVFIKSNRYIEFVGANTLIYFGLHGKCEAIIELLLSKLGLINIIDSSILLKYIACFAVTFLITLILIIPTIIIRKYLPFVMGQWYNKG